MTLHKIFTPMIRLGGSLLVLVASTFGQQSQVASGAGPMGSAHAGAGTGYAPEIDGALAGAAVALVLGGILVATAVRRKRLARG